MRLDKYLKVSRLIKRRTVANDACDAGRVMINGKVAKASVDVKAGDIIEISFGNKNVKVRVTDVKDTVKKEEAKEIIYNPNKKSNPNQLDERFYGWERGTFDALLNYDKQFDVHGLKAMAGYHLQHSYHPNQ